MNRNKKIINYPVNYYPCNVVVNDRWFVELWVSQYYKTKRGRSTISDETIQELVKQLNELKDKVFLRDKIFFSWLFLLSLSFFGVFFAVIY